MSAAPTPQPVGQDPVVVDPKHYKVEFENARVRVLRVKIGPHEKSVMHGHPARLTISLTHRDLRFTSPNGRTQNILGRAGEVIWCEVHEHLPENLSSMPYEGIHIELKSQPSDSQGVEIGSGR